MLTTEQTYEGMKAGLEQMSFLVAGALQANPLVGVALMEWTTTWVAFMEANEVVTHEQVEQMLGELAATMEAPEPVATNGKEEVAVEELAAVL